MFATTRSIELEVRYSIAVDMYRQGFRWHERTNTSFYYLPRSTPTSLRRLTAAFEEVEDKSDEAVGIEWRMVDAAPQSRVGDNSSIVQVSGCGYCRTLPPRSDGFISSVCPCRSAMHRGLLSPFALQ